MSTLDKPWITPDSWSVCFGWDLPCIWSSWGSWLLWLSLHPQFQPPLQPLFPSLPSLCLCTLGEWNDCANVNSPTFSQTQASLGPPRSHPLGLWHPLTTHWDLVPLKIGSCSTGLRGNRLCIWGKMPWCRWHLNSCRCQCSIWRRIIVPFTRSLNLTMLSRRPHNWSESSYIH